LEFTKLLVEYDADVNTVVRGDSLLTMSLVSANPDLFWYFSSVGADIKRVIARGEPIFVASAWPADIRIFNYLIANNADLNAVDSHGNSVLIILVQLARYQSEALAFLLENGADACHKDSEGFTA